MSNKPRYEIQIIENDFEGKTNYRITDTRTDSRVATCYMLANAQMVCEALNFYTETM